MSSRGNYEGNNGHVPAEYYNRDWLYNAYVVEQKACSTIAALLGVSKKNVLMKLTQFGIPRRSPKESKRTKEYLSKMSGENHPLYNEVGGYVTMKRRQYGLKYPCVVCGWHEASTDIHHKIPRGKGGDNTTANLTILCPNHHRMAHRGKLDTSQLPSVDEIVAAAKVTN